MNSNEAAPTQPLDSFLADAGLAFDDIPVAMKIHHEALRTERRMVVDEAKAGLDRLEAREPESGYWRGDLNMILDESAR